MIRASVKVVAFLLLLSCVVASGVTANPVVSLVKERKCPGWSTLCKAPLSENDGCCPYSNATCCGDAQHCCPAGFKCDMDAERCIDNLNPTRKQNLVSTSAHLNAKANPQVMLSAVAQITCPDGSTCPVNHFCCWYSSYGPTELYSCCPGGTVCCVNTGTPQCCPNGYVCNGNRCVKAV